MRILNAFFVLFCLALCSVSCRPEGMIVRVDKASFTTGDQIKIGRTLSRFITDNPEQYPIYNRNSDPELYAYLDEIFRTMVNTPSVGNRSTFPWTVYVLKDSQNLSAFSMPGGIVYITDGFLKLIKNEAQLFAVLSNEMFNSDSGAVMSLLQSHFSGLVLGDIIFDNPVNDLGNMITTLKLEPLTKDNSKFADIFSVDVICPFQYAPDALATVFELELGDSNLPLEWTNIRPSYEERVEKIRSISRECGAKTKLEEERYQKSLVRHLD